MKTRTILFLILGLAILAGLYYRDQKRRVERWTAEVEKTRLLPFHAEKADRIAVENRFGRFELVRRDGAWWIGDPVSERADQKMVSGVLLAALSESSKFGAVPVSQEERGQYGLEKDAVRIRVASSAEKKSADLIVGRATPIAGENYLADAAAPRRVYVTQSNLRRAFERPVLDLRDRRPLDFETSAVFSVASTWEGNRLAFEKRGARDWTIKAPPDDSGRRADARRVHEILRLVEKAFPLSSEEEAKLDPEMVRRAFAGASGAPEPDKAAEHEILLRAESETQGTSETLAAAPGTAAPQKPAQEVARLVFYPRAGDARSSATVAAGKQWLFTANDRKLLFKPPSGLLALLQKPPREYYDRNVFSFESDEVCYLQIEWKIASVSSAFSLEREKDGLWRYPAKPDVAVNQDSVALYITYCLGQMMESDPPPATSALAAGLEEPILRVALADVERSRREGFELGNLLSKTSPFYYARRTGALVENPEEIFLMRLAPSLSEFIKSDGDFAERPALLFNPEDVHRIVAYFRAPDETTSLTLLRSGDDSGAWSGRAGDREPKALPGPSMRNLLLALRGMEYASKPETVNDALLGEYGLQRPALSIHLYDASGVELNALHLGAATAEKGETVLIRNGKNQCYYVRKEALRNMGQALAGVLARMQ